VLISDCHLQSHVIITDIRSLHRRLYRVRKFLLGQLNDKRMASVIGLDQTSQKLQFLDRLSTTGSVAVQCTPTTTSTTTTTTTTTNTTTTTVITTFTTTKYFFLCNRACVYLVGYSVMRLTTHNTIAKRGIPSTANGLHSLFYFEFASKHHMSRF